jgi:hypothetical protein
LTDKIFLIDLEEQAVGAVAQLGERLNGIQEVVGSTPISSTKTWIQLRHLAQKGKVLFF